MRFLNLKITSPDTDDLKIEFSRGLNILSIPDKDLFSLFKQIPFIGMYGKADYEGTSGIKKYFLHNQYLFRIPRQRDLLYE